MQEFSLPSTGGQTFHWHDARGKWLVVYFYPKDDTPGCTVEGSDFRDLHDGFERLGARIVGVSRDSLASHERFKAKLGLPFELLSDAEGTVCALFDVIHSKKMYGKDVVGIQRSTFLYDPSGTLVQEWRGVRSAGHAQEVLDQLKILAEKR
ncbi:MAG: peroxiredoxin [Betaproteobacteria bacterium]|nr:peroxiredoxin [Betaproteobacteria bacterium]